MSDNVDFDALARRTAESSGTMGDLNNLWGAAFALQEWHFIARGELPSVRPYIASNAEYADGKQMIRAFTDTERLARFAKENNLTGADGSAQILSLPTAKLIDYLEQFIQYGVHGIWFNSDTGSDGFFLPLAQLRPVKEYLAKMNWQPPTDETAAAIFEEPLAPVSGLPDAAISDAPAVAAEAAETPSEPIAPTKPEPVETLVVTVQDGLMLPSGFISQASYKCNFFCRVPARWVADGKLKSEHLEKIYEQVYGQNWRMGNDDGSRYVVIDWTMKTLAPGEVATTNWREMANTKENQYWFYVADDHGEIKNVKAEGFQADVDAEGFQQYAVSASTTDEAAAPTAENSAATGGEAVSEFPALHRGEVSFDTSLDSLQAKLAALLENYRGAEQFTDIFPLDSDAMEGLFEKTLSNRHGAILRARHFFYQPDSATMVSVNTLDSNALRRESETDTAAALRVNFALLKYLIDQTALLYFKIEGPETDVRKLTADVRPILESFGFKETSAK